LGVCDAVGVGIIVVVDVCSVEHGVEIIVVGSVFAVVVVVVVIVVVDIGGVVVVVRFQ